MKNLENTLYIQNYSYPLNNEQITISNNTSSSITISSYTGCPVITKKFSSSTVSLNRSFKLIYTCTASSLQTVYKDFLQIQDVCLKESCSRSISIHSALSANVPLIDWNKQQGILTFFTKSFPLNYAIIIKLNVILINIRALSFINEIPTAFDSFDNIIFDNLPVKLLEPLTLDSLEKGGRHFGR